MIYIPETTVNGFKYNSSYKSYPVYLSGSQATPFATALFCAFIGTPNQKIPIVVIWDGIRYETNLMYTPTDDDMQAHEIMIGNAFLCNSGLENTGERFLIITTVWDFADPLYNFNIYSSGEGESHSFSVMDLSESEESVPVYGVEWDYSQSSTKLARINGAVSFADPVPASGLTDTGTSPFDNILPWSGMKRETIGTDEMVYIPKFYFKAEDDQANSKMRWWISAEPMDGFTLHPGSGRYISRYHVDSAYASVSGSTPIGGKTRATYRQNIHAKGDNWWLNDVATWSALQILYLVEFADWNSQVVLGYGQTSGATVATGETEGAAYHTINRSNKSNQYRWIENPYSNIRDFLDGTVHENHRVYVSTNNATFADTSSEYTDTGLSVPTSGGTFIKKLAISEAAPWMFIPSEGGGSATTYVTDYSIGNGSSGDKTTCRVTGGKSSYSAQWGLFLYDMNDVASFTAADVGARSIYITEEHELPPDIIDEAKLLLMKVYKSGYAAAKALYGMVQAND